jgi:glucose/arabinose dehydrogenase
VATASGAAAAAPVQGGTYATSDGLSLRAEVLARDLVAPSDLAVAPDGRVFVTERRGTVRIIDPGGAARGQGAQDILRDLGEPAAGVDLVSLALDRDFARTRFVYVAYVTNDRERPVVRVARLREVAGVLGEGAVTITLPTHAKAASAIVRVGPDGLLYIAIDAIGEPDSAQRPSAPAGKVIRFRRDGSTPDGPSPSPVLSSGHGSPRGLAWRDDGALWEVEGDATGGEVNAIVAGGNYGWPVAPGRQSPAGIVAPAMPLPAGMEPSGITSATAADQPLSGALVVSAEGGEDLFVLRVHSDGRPEMSTRLLERRFGRIGQVAAAVDGALYFVTANEHASGGYDVLLGLQTPDR